MSRKRVAVVIHERDWRFEKGQYLISLLMREWIDDGWEVVVVRGTRTFVPAEVAIAHIDLTVIPQKYLDFLSRYPAVVNGRIPDISKSLISTLLVRSEEEWQGPVIVKTDLNCAGVPERAMAGGVTRGIRSALRILRGRARPAGALAHPYRIYPTFQEVPAEARRDPRLVIERFLPERDGDLYMVRLWTFFGDIGQCVLIRSPMQVVKSIAGVATGELVEPPPGLRERVREIGIDYGKVDFVMHEGTPVVLDVNRTPTYAPPVNERHLRIASVLARGLDAFV